MRFLYLRLAFVIADMLLGVHQLTAEQKYVPAELACKYCLKVFVQLLLAFGFICVCVSVYMYEYVIA